MRAPFVLLVLAAAVHAQWARDLEPGMGRQMIRSVQDDLKALLADPDRLPALIARHAEKRIEALKRFRDPGLRPLFEALLDHSDWQVQHRALLALEYYGDPSLFEKAYALLTHPHRRVREKAAITCLKSWRPGAGAGDLDVRLRGEADFHVRRCLEALRARIEGRVQAVRVSTERPEKLPNGLLHARFLDTPGARREARPDAAENAFRMPVVAARWTAPLMGYGEEEVVGAERLPFGHEREDRRVHAGIDCGVALDGAGIYAVADGVVRLVGAGPDAGTRFVVAHRLEGGELIHAVYLHAGDTAFVAPGDAVAGGQLLGTIGLGFSAENGGRYGHLHFGLYAGPFRAEPHAGYVRDRAALAGWHEPDGFLRRWIDRTRPVMADLRPTGKELDGVVAQVKRGEYGRAYREAVKLRDDSEPGSEVYVDALYVAAEVSRVPRNALDRARRLKETGYPNLALKQLDQLAPRCKGIPTAGRIKEAVEAWESDPLFKKALRGEARILYAQRRAATLKDPAKVRSIWLDLLERYGETCLEPRIREHLGD